jgi:hypothetical protein
MSTVPAVYAAPDPLLTNEVLAHLDAQMESARRMLAAVLEQGSAIRRRDVNDVVRMSGVLQVELGRRQMLDHDRTRLLTRAAARLGCEPGAVTLEAMTALMDANSAMRARERSAELRGVLHETQREHTCNRALMRQELAFLDHLLRLVDIDSAPPYDASAATAPASGARHQVSRVLDLQA